MFSIDTPTCSPSLVASAYVFVAADKKNALTDDTFLRLAAIPS